MHNASRTWLCSWCGGSISSHSRYIVPQTDAKMPACVFGRHYIQGVANGKKIQREVTVNVFFCLMWSSQTCSVPVFTCCERFFLWTHKSTGITLSMSFQHFSTIFLSTTAGWWGWRGCWWGWKASFIKPMRPAPLLGFPAMESVGVRGLAPGLKLTTRKDSRHVPHPTQPLLCVLSKPNTGNNLSCKVCTRAEQKGCVYTVRDAAS